MTLEEKKVQNALNALDPELFLDKLSDKSGPFKGVVYYAVRHIIPGALEPYTAVEWRAPNGYPLPLSLDIVDKVRSQEGSIQEAVATVIANNAAKKELDAQKRQEELDDRIEWQKKSSKRLGLYGPWSNKANVD